MPTDLDLQKPRPAEGGSPPAPRRRVRVREGAVVFAICAVLYLVVAWWFWRNQVIPSDAISRVANAYYTVYSRDPHMAAMGIVWNPLPSFLLLPLLALKSVFPALATDGLASALVSALCMAGFVTVVVDTLGRLGVRTVARICLAVVLALHPMIVIYGGNGMSEALFLLLLAVAARAILLWLTARRHGHLVVAGLSLGLAYSARYEALAAAGATVLLVAAASWWSHRHEPLRRFQLAQADVALIAFPVALSVGLWAMIGRIVSGEWFPTLTSAYGNSAQVEANRAAIESVTGETAAARIWYAFEQIVGLQPVLAVLVLAGVVLAADRRDVRIAGPLAIFGAVSVFHLLIFVQGSSFGWLRFQIVAVPLAVLICGVLLAAPASSGPGVHARSGWSGPGRMAGAVAVVVAAAIGIPAGVVALGDPALAREESAWVTASGRAHASAVTGLNQAIAAEIDAMGLPEGAVTTDSAYAYGIILATARPEQFVISSDRDFAATLADLRGHDVQYLLVSTEGPADAVRTAYPETVTAGAAPAGSRVWSDTDGVPVWRLVPVASLR